ncbi:hypothetical protein ASE75_14085 [Sphingomonas sp. Leaf17]|uniref:hypothetical protein n=1 Tax=Sphingomonas sp. Leaf17 TaxID=1735683 RepID=UPI00070186A2|nr:hypothetical protein [Sphingomonas sp. Leaf17]KQM62746.1 hypothetical protein ASE75_14085 [Sphingomonas sp. Leaf17]
MTRPGRRLPILIFALVWLSCAWFGSWEFNPNNATRLFAAISLVEDGDATIDEFADLTIDKARFAGHAYLDKAPGMTLMAMPAVAIAHMATGETAADQILLAGEPHFTRYLRLRQRIAVAIGPALLTALAAALLYDLGLALTGRAGAGVFAALGFALATPVWGWSTTLLGHAPVAALLVIALWSTWTARGLWPRALLVGLALGWAVVVEYQAALVGGVVAIWAVTHWWPHPRRWRMIGVAALGGFVALVPLGLYNLLAYGTAFHLGYQDVVGFEGMNQGLFGLGVPRPSVLWAILFGSHRGLVWVAPALVLFAPFGLARLADTRPTRALAIMAATGVAVALLVNAAYFYWDGGNSTGPRHAIPLVGLAAIGLAPWWASLSRRAARAGLAALLGLAMAMNLMIASADIFAPPDYDWPVWSLVWKVRFSAGQLQTLPGEWFGWSPWAGLGLYCAIAAPLLALIVHHARRSDRP